MANVTRYDPLKDLDDLFRGFFVRPVDMGRGQVDLPATITVDVKEDEKAYTVEAEMPGVSKEDIHVHVEGNQVSIVAEKKQEKEVKEGDRVLRSERYYGKVSRAFQVASDLDDAAATAKFENGVLHLTLPKKAAAATKRISVQ